MNALAPHNPAAAAAPALIPMMDTGSFEQMCRVGRMLAASPLFPADLRKGSAEERLANGVLVVNMAMRLREDPLTVAQNIYFVNGRPGWNTTYMIAKANMHGTFADPIDWREEGAGDALEVTAVAKIAKTGKEVSHTVTMATAISDGWTRNAKYKSMPNLMLRYRAAAGLIRLYCPEVMIGLPVAIEVETDDMRDVTPGAEAEKEALSALRASVEVNDKAEIIEEEAKHDKEAPQARKPRASKRDETPYTEMAAKDAQKNAAGPATFDDLVHRIRGAETIEQLELVGQDCGKLESADDNAAIRSAYGARLRTLKAESVPPDFDKFIEHIDRTISDEINDGADVKETLEMYDEQLGKIAKFAPEKHAAMLKSYRDSEAGRDYAEE